MSNSHVSQERKQQFLAANGDDGKVAGHTRAWHLQSLSELCQSPRRLCRRSRRATVAKVKLKQLAKISLIYFRICSFLRTFPKAKFFNFFKKFFSCTCEPFQGLICLEYLSRYGLVIFGKEDE